MKKSFSFFIALLLISLAQAQKIIILDEPPPTTVSIQLCQQQVWTLKNLNVSKYRDGTPIPKVTDPAVWARLTTGAWCYYNNDPANGAVYGKLYNWYAVAGIWNAASAHDRFLRKTLAPEGFFIARSSDWEKLSIGLGEDWLAGGKMKETGSTHWNAPNYGATNSSGFTGLPGGYRNSNGIFLNVRSEGHWWSGNGNTEYPSHQFLSHLNDNISDGVLISKEMGFSVRCMTR